MNRGKAWSRAVAALFLASAGATVGLAAQDFGLPPGNRYLYRESVDGRTTGTVERTIRKSPDRSTIILTTPREHDEFTLGLDGRFNMARFTKGEALSLEVARKGSTLILGNGVVKDIGAVPWIQDFLLLGPFAKSGAKSLVFIMKVLEMCALLTIYCNLYTYITSSGTHP